MYLDCWVIGSYFLLKISSYTEQSWLHGIFSLFFERQVMHFPGLIGSSLFPSSFCYHQEREWGKGKQEEPGKNMQIPEATEVRIIVITINPSG